MVCGICSVFCKQDALEHVSLGLAQGGGNANLGSYALNFLY